MLVIFVLSAYFFYQKGVNVGWTLQIQTCFYVSDDFHWIIFCKITISLRNRLLYCQISCFSFRFFFVILQPQNRGKGMKNLSNILNIDKLSKNSGEWVNLLAESPYALQMAMEKYPDIEFHFTSEF